MKMEPRPLRLNPGTTYLAAEISKLAKLPLCLMVAASAAFGYLIYDQTEYLPLIQVTAGIFFLACGAATVNSIQERNQDALYQRTATRPLVVGTVSLSEALLISICFIATGLVFLLLCNTTKLPLSLGVLALIIYNGIYTPLKLKTEFALIAGGISGALPPLIGWTCAGGSLGSPLILSIMTLFFLWQPPHFCLILLAHNDNQDSSKHFTNLGTRFSHSGIKRIITVWLTAFTSIVLFLVSQPGIIDQPLRLIIAVIAPIFLALFTYSLYRQTRPGYHVLFITLNCYLICLMVFLTIGTT